VRKVWDMVAVSFVGLCLSVAVLGCGSATPTGKDKMGSEKMDGGKMGDKMNSEKKDKM
jgi:hypothetical protein